MSVRAALSSLSGVAEVTFDLNTQTATVTMKDTDNKITKEQANKALVAKGEKFKIGSFKEKQ